MTCITIKPTAGVINGELSPTATPEQQKTYKDWNMECKADKELLNVAKDGNLPWIIVLSVVGLVLVAGFMFWCMSRTKDSVKSEESDHNHE